MAMKTKLILDDMSEELGSILAVLSAMGVSTERLKNTAEEYNQSIQDSVMQNIIEQLDEIGETVEDIKRALSAFTEDKKRAADGLSDAYERMEANLKSIKKGRK